MSHLLKSVEDGVMKIVLNRPEAMNALSRDMMTGLTDALTAYKVVRTPVLRSVRLEARRFSFDVELTARLARAGERILEVPIRYNPRSVHEGKKVRWHHAFDMIWTLIRCRVR